MSIPLLNVRAEAYILWTGTDHREPIFESQVETFGYTPSYAWLCARQAEACARFHHAMLEVPIEMWPSASCIFVSEIQEVTFHVKR